MLTLICVAVVAAAAFGLMRGSGHGTLERSARLYLWVAPVPALLALVFPGALAILAPGFEKQRLWSLRLNWIGCWLSAALVLIGMFLMVRRSGRKAPGENRLLLGVIVASLPALLVGLVALLYAL